MACHGKLMGSHDKLKDPILYSWDPMVVFRALLSEINAFSSLTHFIKCFVSQLDYILHSNVDTKQ